MIQPIETIRRTGSELFIGTGETLLDYWAWAHSDIASNAERGKIAEYLVKCALHDTSPFRKEWEPYDVLTPDSIRVEVKSSAYLQTWVQSKMSAIQFDIAPKRAWDRQTNLYSDSICRNSDIYIFCLFSCQDAALANPLDTTQWEFYVLPTRILDQSVPTQKSISLTSLLRLGATKTIFAEMARTVNALKL